MTRRSAIVVRQFKRGRIGVPCVQTWVYLDDNGRWRNCETGHPETIVRLDDENLRPSQSPSSHRDAQQ